MTRQQMIEFWANEYEAIKHGVTSIEDIRWCAFVAGAQAADKNPKAIDWIKVWNDVLPKLAAQGIMVGMEPMIEIPDAVDKMRRE